MPKRDQVFVSQSNKDNKHSVLTPNLQITDPERRSAMAFPEGISPYYYIESCWVDWASLRAIQLVVQTRRDPVYGWLSSFPSSSGGNNCCNFFSVS